LYNYDKLVESAKPVLAEEGLSIPESQQLESYQTGTVDWFRKMSNICK
jgi:hypothetical protein